MRVNQKTSRNKQWLKKPVAAHGYQHWLIDDASLTKRLKQRYSTFHVKPTSVRYAKALTDEHTMLNLKRDQISLVREVVLMSNNQPLVFAHSVLPKRSLRGDWHRLGHLDKQPLGEALFSNPKVRRTSFGFRKLSRRHPLYKKAIKHSECPLLFLWARRSVFSLNGASILVTEIFLPEILEK